MPANATNPMATLRRFVRKRPVVERCELCGVELSTEHQHLLEISRRRLVCSCDGCAILFERKEGGRFRRVPRTIRRLAEFNMSDGQWENLHLPINLAFFYFDSPRDRVVAMFPGPGGATESLLTLEAWGDLVAANPILADMEKDVEALLVNRVAATREYCLVPIDECFKLVGLIRLHWRGLSGGTEVWGEIGKFFDSLQRRSRSFGGRHA